MPAKIAPVSVDPFSLDSFRVNSSNKSLDLKNRLCFGSLRTLFVRNCLNICLWYIYKQDCTHIVLIIYNYEIDLKTAFTVNDTGNI